MIFTLDTSCVVPLLNGAHPRSAATRADFERRLHQQHSLVLVSHALLESFSALTGSPAPIRTSVDDAIKSLADLMQIAQPGPPLSFESALVSMHNVRHAGRSGGAIYDAQIFHLAEQAGVEEFVTWNAKDFLPYATAAIRVVTPQA